MEQMTYLPAAVLARGLGETPDKIAFALLGPARAERWSYARLGAATAIAAARFSEAGWPAGARIGVACGQSSEGVVAVLALMAAGHVPVVAQDAAHLQAAGIAAVVGAPVGDLPVVAPATLRGWIDDTREIALPAQATDLIGFAGADGVVWHKAGEILRDAQAQAAAYDLTAADRMMWAGQVDAPQTLLRGVFTALRAGATLLLPAAGLPTATLALLMKRHDATLMASTPRALGDILRQPIGALPRLRHGISFGEALPPVTAALWAEKTGTDLRDLGPTATPADLAAFALLAQDGIRDTAAHIAPDGTTHLIWQGDSTPTGIDAAVALSQHHGDLPRDGDGRFDHHSPALVQERDQ